MPHTQFVKSMHSLPAPDETERAALICEEMARIYTARAKRARAVKPPEWESLAKQREHAARVVLFVARLIRGDHKPE